MNFARSDSGSITGLDDGGSNYILRVRSALITRGLPDFMTTCLGDAEATFSGGKRHTYLIRGSAWYLDQSGSFIYLSDKIGEVAGQLIGRVSLATINKTYDRVHNITTLDDPAPEVHLAVGRPLYAGIIRGALDNTATILDDGSDPNTAPSTLELPLGGDKVLSTSVIVRNIQEALRIQGGGPIRGEYDYKATGPILEAGTPFNENQFDLVLDLDNGQEMRGTFLALSMQTTLNYARGSKVPFTYQGIMTGAVDFG